MSPCHGQLQAEWVPSTPPKPPQKPPEVASKDGRSFLKTGAVPDETKRGGDICAEGVERTWAMKFLGLSHTACPLLAASITPALANRFGWRAACYCYGLLNIAVGALPFPFRPAFPPLSAVRFLCTRASGSFLSLSLFEPEDVGCCGW